MMKLGLAIGSAVFTVASASSAGAQQLGQGGGSEISVWRVIAALILCLVLAAGGAIALRNRLSGTTGPLALGPGRRLQLLERIKLPHQVDLCLVRCDNHEYLVATSPRDTRFGPEIPTEIAAKTS